MSSLTSALATHVPCVLGEETLQCSLITQAVKAEWEKRRFTKALQGIVMIKSALTPAEYQEQLLALNDAYVRGDYALLNPENFRGLDNPDGLISLFSLLLDKSEDEVTKMVLTYRTEVAACLRLVIKESFGAIVEEDAAAA